jgi:hypothetical protein
MSVHMKVPSTILERHAEVIAVDETMMNLSQKRSMLAQRFVTVRLCVLDKSECAIALF